MSDECKYLVRCPIWQRFQSNVKTIWIANYCKGEKQVRCERRILGESGQPVPEELLPNGTYLP